MTGNRIGGGGGGGVGSTPAGVAGVAPGEPQYIGIVYLGMNPDAQTEGRLLWELNRDRGVAKLITDSAVPDVLTVDGVTYDLSTDEGRRAYIAALGLQGPGAEDLVQLLERQSADSRDEIGQLILVYAQAERGERRMERVVLSGHSSGMSVWGDDNGLIRYELFEVMARIFPRAARQVRDLMLSACYTGSERQIQQYLRMFPEVESIWAYAGSSPGALSGAQDHLRIWEKATERVDPAALDPALAAATRKGENVATWTRQGGYQGDEPITLYEARDAVARGEVVFERYFEGRESVVDPQSGPLRDYYNTVQRLLGFPAEEIDEPWLRTRKDVTLRLLFYAVVRVKFVQHFGRVLEAGYAQAGAMLPDYARASRWEALAYLRTFGSAVEAGPAARDAVDLLNRGLYLLDPELIPDNWI